MTQMRKPHAEHVSALHAIPAPVLGPSHAGREAVSSRPLRLLLADRHCTFLALIGAAVAAALLSSLPQAVFDDTWLALVDGRQIRQHGIPHDVVLTTLGHGHAWIDQQWLAQLWMYALYHLGGLALVGVLNVALMVTGLASGAMASIRLGASARSVLPVFLLVAITVTLANEVRTQAYAYPLFALTVYLLAADSRRPGKSVYWCLPVLVLWANVHGSATLGAGLVGVRGLSMLWERRHGLAARLGGPLALIVGAPLALLATPYGTGIIPYYRATLLSPAFRTFVAEWGPVTESTQLAVMFFVLAGVTLWALGRYTARATLWERAVTVILAAGAIVAVRNVVWFALAVLILLPVWIDAAVRARERPAPARPRLNASLLGALGAVVIVVLLQALSAGAVALSPRYPPAALAAVRAAVESHPGARVFADERYADWLLWELPSLRGRVAYDAAFELLSREQLQAIAEFKTVTGLEWQRAARGYRVLVLVDAGNPNVVHALRRGAGVQVRYDHGGVAVLER